MSKHRCAGQREQPLPQLRGAALRVGAADVDVLALLPAQLGAARRAVRGHDELALATVAQVHDGPERSRG